MDHIVQFADGEEWGDEREGAEVTVSASVG
jgi:hypothetical protein